MTDSGAKGGKKRRRGSYHHGDLRAALVDAATEILRTEGLEGLSLRAIARAAGVSQTAPYRHFESRRELVGAVAEVQFRRLGQRISEAVAAGEPGLDALRRGMAAYVEFGVENPAEYRVMFGPKVAQREDLPELSTTSRSVFGLLSGGIQRMQEMGALSPGDATARALTAWSTLHGLVMLILDGQAPVGERPVEAAVSGSIDLLLEGMGANGT